MTPEREPRPADANTFLLSPARQAVELSVDARDEVRFARFTEASLGLPDGAAGPTTPDAAVLRLPF
ncbi:hypothetical protein GCM10023170_020200 [Phytohabitans houttuyneae]|uniref:Uncharacterized protein n=1 Tax=Phytohabitans houttuyneae TaxID=1076126 RepID=A0A6V8K1J1_9ACTN|nr:hypothetical protein Phou_004210 [Phytohabitans houttuyneae]